MRKPIVPYALLGFILLLWWVGCAGQNTTGGTGTSGPPTPPQVTVANSVNVLAQAVDGAVTAAIAARDQGKVSQADLSAIEAYCKAIAVTGKSIDAELRSTDAWAVQKPKIVQIMTGAGLNTLKGHISPTAQALVTTLVVIANQISVAVGGPAL